MLRQQTLKRKQNRKFPGICGFAIALKVGREHVWRVLIGQRHSPRVIEAARKQWPAHFPKPK